MAEVILANVLNSKISVDNLFEWLTTDNPEVNLFYYCCLHSKINCLRNVGLVEKFWI